jgi:alpha-galactosidase
MGVNTLAFRLSQNRAFFIVDADCVPITKAVEWKKTRMWLDAVARSGTALIISPELDAVGAEQRDALRDAFARAAAAPTSAADDMLLSNAPQRWTFQQSGQIKKAKYEWDENGASPFSI